MGGRLELSHTHDYISDNIAEWMISGMKPSKGPPHSYVTDCLIRHLLCQIEAVVVAISFALDMTYCCGSQKQSFLQSMKMISWMYLLLHERKIIRMTSTRGSSAQNLICGNYCIVGRGASSAKSEHY